LESDILYAREDEMPALILVGVCAVALLAGLAVLLRRLIANRDVAFDPAWLEQFSTERYRPMVRLLADHDEVFLATTCGYTAKMIRRVRSERRRIFRAYLRNVVRDFNRLHHAARVIMLDSPVDRPDLAALLMRQRVAFTANWFAVQWRLALHTAGFGPVDARDLLQLLDGMKVHYDLLSPARVGAY
jgi:hypothetical protein